MKVLFTTDGGVPAMQALSLLERVAVLRQSLHRRHGGAA
jgi:hypothetical protein